MDPVLIAFIVSAIVSAIVSSIVVAFVKSRRPVHEPDRPSGPVSINV